MISIQGKTHVGGRVHNEDRFVADAGWGIALVSDGMGGPEAGEVAAEIVATVLVDGLEAGQALADVIVHAHDEIRQAPQNGKGSTGMGATLVIARFADHDFDIAWIGDSRAYLWNGTLRQLTRDHSKLELLLARGELTPAQARDFPQKNIITRAVGLDRLTRTDVPVLHGTLARGQQLLLCSDGVSDVLPAGDIAAIMAADAEPGDKLERIINAALAAQGTDNITAVLATADDAAPAASEIAELPAVSIAWPDGRVNYFKVGEDAESV